jgi:osmoprotectant transport system substrate-binding protein
VLRRATGLVAALAAGLLLVLGLGACGGGGDDNAATVGSGPTPKNGPPIRIGVKNFTEQSILGELYRQALEAKGFEVVLKSDVGSSEIIHRTLRRGVLDMYPEYIGVLLSEVAELRQRPRSAQAAYDAAQAYERRSGFSLLEQTPFSDANALGVKPAYAKRHDLRTIADLRHVKGTVKVGALAEFATRFEGIDGLKEVYGLRHLRTVAVESNGRYAALDSGRVDVASVFTTEGQLVGDKYVVLADPRGLFASGHVAPIVSRTALNAHGAALPNTLNAVSRALTTTAMRQMNAAVDVKHDKPAAVATTFLRSHNLL